MSAIWNNKVLDKVHKYLSAGNTMPRHSFSMYYGNYKDKQLLHKLNDHDCIIEHNKVLSNGNKYLLAGDKIFNHHRKNKCWLQLKQPQISYSWIQKEVNCTLKLWNDCRRQEAYLIKGVIPNQQAHQINYTTSDNDTRSNKWNSSPPLMQPCWQPCLWNIKEHTSRSLSMNISPVYDKNILGAY